MPALVQSATRNAILRRFSSSDFALLASRLTWVDCPPSFTLVEPNTVIADVFFMEDGVASVVASSPEGHATEAGIIGREGFVIPAVVLGSDRVTTNVAIQVAGSAYRIDRLALVDAALASLSLRDVLVRFAQVLMVQTTYTLLANAVHQIDKRLARWLLMCHDRVDGDHIHLTHDFMSIMLSVRRPSVTNALHILEGDGFIRSDRGFVTIVNRRGLQTFAADAYGRPEAEFRRLIGAP